MKQLEKSFIYMNYKMYISSVKLILSYYQVWTMEICESDYQKMFDNIILVTNTINFLIRSIQ